MDRPSSAPSTPSDAEPAGESPEVVGVDSDEADAIISALSSDTARAVLECLHEEPDTHSGLADRLDTTIQTVEYHISNLEEAGLVTADGAITSEHGQEMTVYAPADGPLVVLAGGDEDDTRLRAALRETLGGVGVLALASLVVDRLLSSPAAPTVPAATSTPTPPDTDAPGAGGADGATPTPAGTEDAAETATPTPAGTEGAAETATPTATPVGTPTEAPAGTPTPTPAPDGTPTPTPPPDGTPTPTPAPDGTPTPRATETPAPTPTGVTEEAATQTPAPTSTEVARDAATGAPKPGAAPGPELFDLTLSTLPPGAVFFIGGLLGIVLAVALTHRGRLLS
jgi:DNA-binding transcriptional ArsR family regulator